MLATKLRYTFADLLTQSPEDERIYDILGGDLVVNTSPSAPHALVVSALTHFLFDAQIAGYGWACTAPLSVAFDYGERGMQAMDVTHPDVLFVTRARREIIGERCIEAAPDLVIEVLSPSIRLDDLPGGRKFELYERYGVAHYWLVDTNARTVTQYVLRAGRYGEATVLREGDRLTSPLFPSVTRDVAAIFAALP
jgi:Uma2 family endonuclease